MAAERSSSGAGAAPAETPERPIVVHPAPTGDRDGDVPAEAASPSATASAFAPSASASASAPPAAAPAGRAVGVEPFDADGPVPAGASGESPGTGAAPRERAAGLDAFRGLFLLAMNFAFTIPFGVFAQWMYHRQFPSPSGEFAAIPGLGWRDLLFGGFLFAMAAALPITMGARLRKGASYPSIIITVLKRAFLLMTFALIIGHVNPYWTQDYTKRGNVMAMIGFIVCFWLFTRRKESWNESWFRWFRWLGWAAAIALLLWGPTFYGETFSLHRRDDIIASIAFAAVAGTVAWLLTRYNPVARLGVLGIALALKLAAGEAGWVQNFWGESSVQWLFQPWYIELMLIVIPGTIAGDLLVRWMRPATPAGATLGWSRYRLGLIALVSIMFLPIVLIGTYTRYTATTTLIVAALAFCGSLLCLPARTERERVLAGLFWWSAFWLVLGMVLEPFEGGIKKVPQTISYLFVSAGLSGVILLATVVVADAFGQGRRLLRPLVEVGQNPMLAYVLYMLFLNHLLYLLGVGDFLTGSATEATVRGFIIAGVVAAAVWGASRARLYWRA